MQLSCRDRLWLGCVTLNIDYFNDGTMTRWMKADAYRGYKCTSVSYIAGLIATDVFPSQNLHEDGSLCTSLHSFAFSSKVSSL